MENQIIFKENNFNRRLKSMLSVDFRRMFTMPLYYIMVGIAFIIPILILVMTSMMPSTTIDPTTGVETTINSFTNVWQAISQISGNQTEQMSMDLTSMCNLNMMYFMVAIIVCIFISDDFRSGYSKNLFSVRSDKKDYVISKTLVSFISGVSMIIAYFIGAMIGGAIAGLPFSLGDISVLEVIMCMLSKIFLVLVFVSIFVVMAIVGKKKLWLSILVSLGTSMLLFTMIPMMTPLNSNIINVVMTLSGGILFSIGLGAVSNILLNKTSLV